MFFDLDGTLLDSIPILYRNYCDFLARYGCHGSQEEFKFVNGPALPEIIKHLKQVHKIPGSEEEIMADYDAGLEKYYRDVVEPRKGADELLRLLVGRGDRLSLVTSTHESLVEPILNRLGWRSLFSAVITGEVVERAKPKPDIYLYALSEAGAVPEETVSLEDSPNGTRAVVAAGCIPVALAIETPEELLIKAGAKYIIHSLDEFSELVDRLNPVQK